MNEVEALCNDCERWEYNSISTEVITIKIITVSPQIENTIDCKIHHILLATKKNKKLKIKLTWCQDLLIIKYTPISKKLKFEKHVS